MKTCGKDGPCRFFLLGEQCGSLGQCIRDPRVFTYTRAELTCEYWEPRPEDLARILQQESSNAGTHKKAARRCALNGDG